MCDAIAVVDVAVSVVRGGDAVAVVVGGAGGEAKEHQSDPRKS